MTLAVKWVGSPNFTPGRAGHNPTWSAADPNTWFVVHTTVSSRASADARFRSPTGGASPTYMIDTDGTIYQYVKETDAPWTNGTMAGVGSNLDSITCECVDNGAYNSPRKPAQLEALAQLMADVHRRRGIPLIHRGPGGGVLGHKECQGASTACPDSLLNAFPAVLARANAIANPPKPAPVPVPPAPIPAPQPAPVPEPEWARNLVPHAVSVQLYVPVPLRDMATGVAKGNVPQGQLETSYRTTVGSTAYLVTQYAKDHAEGLGIPELAVEAASVPPPAPPEQPAPDTTPAPVPAPGPPPPGAVEWLQSLLDWLRKTFGGS